MSRMNQRVLRVLHQAEDTLLAVLLGVLLLLSVLQIILRVFFNTGFDWAEPVGRQGVLWLALLGALGATRDKKHIAIDALVRVLPTYWHRAAWVIAELAAAGVCLIMAWLGWGMVQLEREAPSLFAGQIPSWWPMLAFPIGFSLMGLRFVVAAIGEPSEFGAESSA